MRHIDLTGSSGQADEIFGLYLAGLPGRLLIWIQSEAGSAGEIEPTAQALAAEGWHVLHIRHASHPDSEAAAATITDALARAAAHIPLPPGSRLPIVTVAESISALPACIAVLQSHHQAGLPAIGGVVTVDAFENAATAMEASVKREIADVARKLAEIDSLATIVAAHQRSHDGRRMGLSYHRKLQALGRDTHFIVLADDGPSLAARLADRHDPLGREIRWLLDPVHSRTDM